MQQKEQDQVDIEALKSQVDAEIAARLELEAEHARYIHRRGFRIGDLRLLVGIDATSEVAQLPPLFRLPGAPKGVRGLANRHGRVVPVICLPALFDGKQEQKVNAWMLVCGHGDEAVGIIIDQLPERKRFAEEDEVPLAGIEHPIAGLGKAAYRQGEETWIDLDLAEVFMSVFKVDPAAG